MGRNFPSTEPQTPETKAMMEELYARSPARSYTISMPQFAAVLHEIAAKQGGEVYSETSTLRQFLLTLRLDDLILARACAAGSEPAWEVFLTRYREKLYDIAGYITKETAAARELADSIYADLYGTNLRDGQRVSKLSSYTGRGSLEGWLRTVMAQEYVNRYRRQRRLVSFEEEAEEGKQFAAVEAESAITLDPRLEAATDEALGALAAEDRFLLSSYYLDDKTLAEIGRALSVHESTISRKLDKMLKSLRKQILGGLGRRGMSRRQAAEALEADIRDFRLNIRQRLTQDSAQENPVRAFSKGKAEVPGGQ